MIADNFLVIFGFLSNKNCVNICSHKKSSQNICPSAWWACYAITSSFSYKTGNNSWSKLNMHISSLNSSGSKAKKGGRSSRRSHIFCNKSFAPISPYSHQKLFSPLWSLQFAQRANPNLLKFPLCKLSSNSFWLLLQRSLFFLHLLLSQRSSLGKLFLQLDCWTARKMAVNGESSSCFCCCRLYSKGSC